MPDTIEDIIHLYLNGEVLTAQQDKQLQQWLQASGNNREALRLLEDPVFLQQSVYSWDNYDASQQAGWERLSGQLFGNHKGRVLPFRRFRWWVTVAAAVCIAIAAAWLLMVKKPGGGTLSATVGDVLPGGTGAILTLSDGRKIVLDSLGNGQIAQQNGAVIHLNNHKLVYNAFSGGSAGAADLNTLSTPAGRQFTVVLPDGSTVWLNAGSAITYPSLFAGSDRKIKVSGEVYMEVAPHKSMPFMVDIDGRSIVQVLGTSFNINAYNDDNNIVTTLVTGSVKAGTEKAASAVILKAGEQAVQSGLQVVVRRAVDIDKVLAWKNGYFSFDNMSLRQVARQIERWYDIKVLFEADAGNMSLTGDMDRGVSLSGIRRFLHQYGLKTTLENRVLTVSAK
ncbi:FecR family protein [Filimonas effusa]|uniref:DUF4974 domain-containing protein n=1 Tax=Filimonas effusa TaxID=2508721 RepID=A0A4Q1DDN0_9BACT|nr:FecR domain-containing protein [Filimonas effusa]RXK86773.1 DUF4974 domain-containing protein [Filimonas effusa]